MCRIVHLTMKSGTFFLITALFGCVCTTDLTGYINTNFGLTDLLPWIFSETNFISLSECFMLCQTSPLCRGITYQRSTEGCKLLSYDYTDAVTIATSSIGSSATVPAVTTWVFYHIIRDCNSTGCPVELGYTLMAENCFCIKYHPERIAYSSAALECQTEGGELIKIEKPITQAFVAQYLGQLNIEVEDRVYIQGRKSGGKWVYDDGTEIQYFNYYSSEPSGNAAETILFISTTQNYKWHDGGHGWYAYICEVKL